MLRVRGAAVVACTALVLSACSGGSDDDAEASAGTAVLGAATEREQPTTPTPSPTSEPVAAPGPTGTEGEPAWVRETAEPTPEPTATLTPTSAPDPAPEPTSPPEEEPGSLLSGSGWSMNTLLPDEDGEGWTEVGGQPPVEADGDSAEHLFAQLAHEPTAGDVAGRNARCRGWVEAPADAALRVHGEVVIELLVGGDAVGRSVHTLDLTLGAGQRHDLPTWQRPTRLHAAEGDTVTCSAWFFEAG